MSKHTGHSPLATAQFLHKIQGLCCVADQDNLVIGEGLHVIEHSAFGQSSPSSIPIPQQAHLSRTTNFPE